MFGFYGGPTLGTQTWNGVDRDPVLAFNSGVFIEPYKEDSPSSFFAKLGYHQRGSSQGGFLNNIGGVRGFSFLFNNAVLTLGTKKRFSTYNINKPYYNLGLRVEYTVSTNLSEYDQYGGYFPIDGFVNKFNYGPTAGIGYEMRFSEFIGGFVEANLNPDISFQYEQPQINNVLLPFGTGTGSIGMQSIRNMTFEVTLGLRLLRKIEYID